MSLGQKLTALVAGAVLLLVLVPAALAQGTISAEDTQAAQDLWKTMQDAKYPANWATVPGKGTFYQGQAPHLDLLSTYLNPPAAAAQKAPPGKMPDGSIIVKEVYKADKTLTTIAVMQKKPGYDPEHGDWFYATFKPDGTPAAAGKIAGCIRCHGAAQTNGYIFTFLVAPIKVDGAPATDADKAKAADIWKTMQDAKFETAWATIPGKGTFYKGQPPHGALLSTYLNPSAADAMTKKAGKMPDGALIVKENYKEDKTLINIAVAAKVAGYDPANGDWFWAMYGPDGTVAVSGKAAGCINCHGAMRSNDYIFTSELAPITVAAPAAAPAATAAPAAAATPAALPTTGGVLSSAALVTLVAVAAGLLVLGLGILVMVRAYQRAKD